MINISKEEFISEVLKDDLASGRKPHLNSHKNIIQKPNLSSKEENMVREKLINLNGAFVNLFEQGRNMEFYLSKLTKEEFLKLEWCPKGSAHEKDGIDIMTENTRLLSDLLKYLKKNIISTDSKVITALEGYFSFNSSPLKDSPTNRLFLLETNRMQILDGNHRAGSILKKLSQNGEFDIFPITIYTAKKR